MAHHSGRLWAIALTLALGCSSATAAGTEQVESILFIGNSLTYTNDLPGMVEKIARAAGNSIRVGMVAGPNMAVIDHTVAGAEAVARIAQDRWSFVVLQQGPTPAGICRDTLVIAAMRLRPRIEQAGGRAVLFAPWPRRSVPQSLGPAGESATAAARAVGGVVAPAGIAWKEALEEDGGLPLYGGDGYHPAPAGTLLAALTIYDRLTGHDVRTIPTSALADAAAPALPPGQLAALLDAAHGASTGIADDPTVATPADTTKLSSGGGPC
jgi:hypothetical protein